MKLPLAALAVVALLVPGCLSALNDPLDPAAAGTAVTDVRARAGLPFVLDDEYSRVLVNGTFAILPVESVFVDVALPLAELGSAADGSAKVHMGLWLPDVPAGTKVPVIADVGPYYADGDVPATEPANRLGKFLIENFVPHGYAVAQVSVFGTGESTHCMDLMGRSEQLGIDAAVTWLGAQEWSNGNVGLIGRSYDGSTPWEAATFGNPALKTIVPISGLTGMHNLMWRNGSAETRGPIMHNGVYGRFGIDTDPAAGRVDPGDRYTLCKGYLEGPAMGVAAYATGSPMAPYWQEREFMERALQNYEGSVYMIHGLQDWNVDPHVGVAAFEKLQAAGFETKALFGQWAHMYPDRASEHENLREGRGKEAYPASVRLDWAQDLLEWFDHYLKGTGAKPALVAEVQDNLGGWRIEATYPPQDAAWTQVDLCAEGPQVLAPARGNTLVCSIEPLSATEDVRIAGLPQLHLKVTPTGPGGQVYALLVDAETGMHLGHAIMDLRYHAGGIDMRPVVPGQPIVAMMEFEPLDVVLPAGHGLVLKLSGTGEDYLPSAVLAPLLVDQAASVFRLPVVERGEDAFFTPPGPVGPPKGETKPF
ncbi:MAG TPA: CocE/NonD family hydrolase [Candidatus Thermoplasmatota archaeon]|nr:CocE/NonD family hydrolase [Candidatus Thermoplasmatota archaeon]